jgi:REP element-mobilizing transposase RayT
MLRGNDKQAIFIDDADRRELEALVEDGVDRFGHRIHAYCWMGNHIHMAIQLGEIPLSKIMHNLSFRYTSYFNWRHARVGHVFQGRYKALLIDADSRLQELVRYIHLNPVRAGIVADAVDFEWSGHRVYLGLAHKEWISTETVLSLFGSDRASEAKLCRVRRHGVSHAPRTRLQTRNPCRNADWRRCIRTENAHCREAP